MLRLVVCLNICTIEEQPEINIRYNPIEQIKTEIDSRMIRLLISKVNHRDLDNVPVFIFSQSPGNYFKLQLQLLLG